MNIGGGKHIRKPTKEERERGVAGGWGRRDGDRPFMAVSVAALRRCLPVSLSRTEACCRAWCRRCHSLLSTLRFRQLFLAVDVTKAAFARSWTRCFCHCSGSVTVAPSQVPAMPGGSSAPAWPPYMPAVNASAPSATRDPNRDDSMSPTDRIIFIEVFIGVMVVSVLVCAWYMPYYRTQHIVAAPKCH